MENNNNISISDELKNETKTKSNVDNSNVRNPNFNVPLKTAVISAASTREEGELSTSASSSDDDENDDDENPVSSGRQSAGSINPPAPTGLCSVPSFNNLNKGIVQASKATSSDNPENSVGVQSRSFLQSKNDKGFEKNKLRTRSANTVWRRPPGADTNLVIRFSDDDTGSESEDCRLKKALELRRKTAGADNKQRLFSLVSAKPTKLQPAARNVNKVLPKKSLSRTFVSDITRINGGDQARVAGSSSAEQVSRVRNLNTMKRKLSNEEHVSDQCLGLNTTKLRDLRQQIELREKELKLKAVYQNKDFASVSGRDYNSGNLGAGADRKSDMTSLGIRMLEATEPDKKRLKVTGTCSTQPVSDRHQEIVSLKSHIPLKELALGSNGLQDRNMIDHDPKGNPPRKTDSRTVKWKKQDDKLEDNSENLSSALKEGANVTVNDMQTDRCSMQMDPSVLLNQNAPLTNVDSNVFLKNKNNVILNHPLKIGGRQLLGSFSKTTSREQLHDAISNDREVGQALDNTCQASLDHSSRWNYVAVANVSEHDNMDMDSLVEMEESLDKELGEAQEQRRICEIEERNALKAYRKAQRALVEANSRCTDLYRRRELYSAHFRSLFLSDSGLSCSTGKQERVRIGFNQMDNSSRSLQQMPPSNLPERPDYDRHNQPGYDLNIQSASDSPLNAPYIHVNGQNLSFEPCSEPDASTSEPLYVNRKPAADIASSPNDRFSADEDEETSPLKHKNVQPYSKIQQREQASVGRQKESAYQSNEKSFTDCSPDSLILEATLRSELFARLGKRTFSKPSSPLNLYPADEVATDSDNGSERTQTSNGSALLSEPERNQEFGLGGNDQPERNNSEVTFNIQNQKKNDDEYSSAWHPVETFVFSPSLVLRSAFGHMKYIPALNSIELQSQKGKQDGSCDYKNEADCTDIGDIHCAITIADPMEEGIRGLCGQEVGSFTSDLLVDPFWPLCTYELRGKCNNDQCPWQHVRDFSNGKVGRRRDDFYSSDCQVGLLQTSYKGTTELSKFQCASTPPTYIVGLDILKYDPHKYNSVVTQGNGQCWKKCFTICIALSNFLQKDLPADEPFLLGSDGRIEVQCNSEKQLSYFQSRKSIVNHPNLTLPSTLQSLEMAFLMLSQEANKLEGMKKALSVLSRAIEAVPNSDILWIIYLLIYNGNVKSVAKDDMYSYAVKHNDKCYVIWLLYINSRTRIDYRLVAYDAALTALCRSLSTYEKDEMYASACILDVFLQMMDFLCMSGNVDKAIQKICRLFLATDISDQHHSLVLSDVLACLKVSDKCMFWVCCVYLVMYKKLPDAIVHKFECYKDLLAIEWPRVHLPDEEKQRAIQLVDMAVDSVKEYVNIKSLGKEVEHKSMQYFGLCHVRCMVALDCLECCRSLLDEYMKKYPSCLEFVLISARVQMNNFEGFEEALRNWPKEIPGIHCIWNQYIEFALQKEGPDFAKVLIVRWFSLLSGDQFTPKEKSDDIGSLHVSLEKASASNLNFLTAGSNHSDLMFGYLNLSLGKLLHNDQAEARDAIDRAFKSAVPAFFEHCLREHSAFLLKFESQLNEGASISKCLNVLNRYLDKIRAFPVSEPLSRQFIEKIEKPRMKQLISNILTPVSSEYVIVNLVLEVWYGPSLIPQVFSQPKELVDFVEAVLEIVPDNYPLAFSACKLLTKGEHFINLTSGSMLYWASSTLANAIFHAIPIAPEYKWLDAAGILDDIAGIELIRERFYRKALSAYPFSVKLWKRYHNLSKTRGDVSFVVEAARAKGIELG
ncbi:uncharacterized protein LOC126659830 isoform X2 [Mercurialis annua]|uniref:uncharacterized protein LOC126659830 isoform X2 n=1 Tax=Mercurialis annua TaxID=3986 RepID=UPI00215FAF99|nr:uncharacterized protein LOC126659830 isoform X2 [Mercurialis annua]